MLRLNVGILRAFWRLGSPPVSCIQLQGFLRGFRFRLGVFQGSLFRGFGLRLLGD